MANLYASGEDYLETILRLKQQNGVVRSIDIARELDYSKPSISRAMKILQEKGLIEMDESKFIHLTEKGLYEAEKIYDKHILLRSALIDLLGVSEEVAEEDACRIEHVISDETVERLKVLMATRLIDE